jgi:hypothetical protein
LELRNAWKTSACGESIKYAETEMNVVVVFDVRKRERYGCEKRRRICVIGEEAENGLQRTVKQSSRLKAAKQNVWLKQLRRSEMVK